MLIHQSSCLKAQHGVTMVEVLVTVVILAFGLLGLAGMQSKMNLGMVESYQRAQAVVVLSDMTDRMKADLLIPCKNVKGMNCDSTSTTINAAYTSAVSNADAYVAANPIGTGDSQPADCSGATAGANRNLCEWSKMLKGSAETKGNTNVGAMTNARGCITQLQAIDASPGVCTPGIYQITVAWQGIHQTKAPSVTCGKDMYGDDSYRRAISVQVAVPLPQCS